MTEKVQIGKTDLYVNPIGIGTNKVGGHNLFPDLNNEQGKDTVRFAINNGVDFIDTAYLYGPGYSEELIGEVVQETGKRSDLVIATKVSPIFNGNEMSHDNSPAFLKEEVEKSLKRLKTDYIDLLYIHYPDESTPKDEAVGALKALKDEGKIRAIGLSNFSMDQLKEANKDGYVDVYQGEYSLLNREAEKELLPYALEQNISFVQFFPLVAGLLAGKYNKDSKFDDLRAGLSYFQGETFKNNLEKVEQIRNIANGKDTDVANIVLAWYLTRGAIDVIIPGAKNPDQVQSNLKTLDVTLTNEEIETIDRIFKS